MNTLSAKADSFLGESDYCPTCTPLARSEPRVAVATRLTTKLALILGDPGRELPAAVSSNRSDLLPKFYPRQDTPWNRILLKEPVNDTRSLNNPLSAIPPSAKADGPLA